MNPPLQQILHDWQPFYQLTGGVAGTLIGLMFVSISLAIRSITPDTSAAVLAEKSQTVRTFASPTIIHLTAVVIVAAVMLMPNSHSIPLSLSLAAVGLVGIGYCVGTYSGIREHHRRQALAKSHWVFHVRLPLLCYAAIIGTALALATKIFLPFSVLAAANILFLVVGIRNSWTSTLYSIGLRA